MERVLIPQVSYNKVVLTRVQILMLQSTVIATVDALDWVSKMFTTSIITSQTVLLQ